MKSAFGAGWTNTDLPLFGNDVCVVTPVASGTTCDDGDACTSDDVCSGDVCAGTTLAVPGEVQNLMLNDQSGATLTWTADATAFGYDVAGGMAASLIPDGGVTNATCVGNDIGATSFVDGRPDPPQGESYYYLVRGQNACGQAGTYGNAYSGVERTPPSACP